MSYTSPYRSRYLSPTSRIRDELYLSRLLNSGSDVAKKTDWTEFLPVNRTYIDYIGTTPITRNYTDYVEIKHEIDYLRVPRLEKKIEYVPVEKYETVYDLEPVTRSYIVNDPVRDELLLSASRRRYLRSFSPWNW